MFYVQLIYSFKFHRQGTFFDLLFDVTFFQVCKLVLTHIGKNFPCTQLPGHTPTGDENTVWGFAGTDFAEDTQVVLAFAVR